MRNDDTHTTKDKTISLRVSEALVERLDALAAKKDRSRSYIIIQALEEKINYDIWLEEQIESAMDKADDETAIWVPHKHVDVWLEKSIKDLA